ncbi:hypothetical protein GAMM_60178 [Gammaproteobacteria bacterium]
MTWAKAGLQKKNTEAIKQNNAWFNLKYSDLSSIFAPSYNLEKKYQVWTKEH